MKVDIRIENGNRNVFFTADTHFSHKNIVKGVSSWDSGYRDFDTIDEHDDYLIERINEKVKCNDVLFILGDFMFNNYKDIDGFIKMRNRINCKHIYFVYGNHDDIIEDNPELHKLFIGVDHFISLVVTIAKTNEKNVKYKFDLSHYSKRTWSGLYTGTIMLYGHSHNMLEPNINKFGDVLKTMDVGVDTKSDFSPYSLEEIIEIMEYKQIPNLDNRLKS